jgi:zinc transport system permease protein
MFDFLDYGFMQNALLAGLLASIVCGIVGTLVVVRRIVSLSGSVSHSAFGGIGIGYYLGINPILGALVFSIGSALGIGAVSKYAKEREDTVIGMFWAAGMAIGVLFIGLTPGYAPDLFGYLFGSIISIPTSDLILIFLLNVFVIGIVALLFKELVAVAFDEEYSAVAGLPVKLLYYLTLILVAITIVALIRMVGIILAIALLTMPAAIAGKFTHNIKKMMALSVVLSVLFITTGLWMSFVLDIESGATIILVAAAAYTIVTLVGRLKRRSKRTVSA